MSFRTVVIGYDFSASVSRATDWVHRQLAPDARLALVHAVELEPMPSYLQLRFPRKPEWVADEIARADDRLRAAAREHGADEAATVVRAAKPHELLRAHVRAVRADLLVVGAHRDGSRPWKRIGSTTERLLRADDSSLLVARGAMEGPPQRILVAVDDAGVTPVVLSIATDFRRRFAGRLRAVHVLSNAVYSHVASIDAARASSESDAQRQLARDIDDEARRWLREIVAVAGTDEGIDAIVPHGSPSEEVIRAAEEFAADLIVIGRYGVGRVVPAVLGSVLGSVVHGASCPVLVVSDVAARDS
jgi:nucleotide-binding universal stress UspA family protein